MAWNPADYGGITQVRLQATSFSDPETSDIWLPDVTPYSALEGFMCAAGILVAASQLRNLLGMEVPHGRLLPKLLSVAGRLDEVNPTTTLVGVGGVFMLHGLKVLNRRLCPGVLLPEQLVLLMLATLGTWALGLDIPVVGTVPYGLPSFHFPLPLSALDDPSEAWALLARMAQPTLTVGTMAYIISMSIVRTMALRYGYRVDANRELCALGVANMVGSCFYSLPVSDQWKGAPSTNL